MRGGPTITHLDDVPAEEMLRFRFRDGSTASVWEKWIELSPNYVAFWNRWEPGAMTAPHGHTGDHINFILSGEIRSKHGVARAGSHIMLEHGDIFGPWVAGPDGCELYGFIAGEGSPFAGDADEWAAFLDEHGAELVALPPPTRLPPWSKAKFAQVTNWTKAEN